MEEDEAFVPHLSKATLSSARLYHPMPKLIAPVSLYDTWSKRDKQKRQKVVEWWEFLK